MSIEQKKINRLRKELQFLQSELEYVREVLSEWHFTFEEYHRDYCKRKQIDLDKLNRQAGKKNDHLFQKPENKENGVIVYDNKKDKDVFKAVYKQIARKLHPDVGGDEEEFKKAVAAMQEKNLEKLLDICDKHVIYIKMSKQMTKLLEEQISDIKKEISKEKSTYSWSLYSCTDNKCKDNVIKKFLKHLFNYEE